MKILLVNPPVNRLCDVPINYFPLGLGYLAALANQRGYDTKIYNADLEIRSLPVATNRRRIQNHELFVKALQDDNHIVWKEFREVVGRFRPDVIGFSCTSASIMPCLKMARDAKRNSGAITVFGGMHPTILPEDTARYSEVDFVVTGEAEESFTNLIDTLFRGEDPLVIPGVGSMRDGDFIYQPSGPPPRDIEHFPIPDRNALVFMERHKPYLHAILTSRGCPYQCTFCSGNKIHCGMVRFLPTADVIQEIEFLRDHFGVNYIAFYDDALVLKKKRMAQLCQEMISRKVGVTWGGFTRADSVDKELLALMKQSGCVYLGMGVESGSDRILSLIKKGYTRAQAIEGVRLVQEAGIQVTITMMVGFPFENEKDIRDSISLIEELGVPTNVNTFVPYPGSELYDECIRLGLIDEQGIDWSVVSQHSPYNAFVHEISVKTYEKLLNEMVEVADRLSPLPKVSKTRVYARRLREIWSQEKENPMRFAATVGKKALRRIKSKAD
jgi:radical SAM superfamily enzyme YgiQ (UPF0313 family)